MRFVIDEGERLPRGWGVAWFQQARRAAVVLPVPINLVAGVLARLYWGMQRGVRPGRLQRAEEEVQRLRAANEHLSDRIQSMLEKEIAEKKEFDGVMTQLFHVEHP